MILLVVALSLRFLGGWYLGHLTNPVPWEYEEVANNLLAGNGFTYQHFGVVYHAYVAPIYTLFCAAVYAVTDHSHAILLSVQCLISAGSCLLLRDLGRLAFRDVRIADYSAWLLAFHPGLIVYATRLHPLTLDMLSFIFVLWAWIHMIRRPSTGSAILAGLSGGVAIMSRGTIALFILVGAACFSLYARISRRELVCKLAVAVGIVALVMLPWLVRNAILFHKFPVLQTNEGLTLWIGNNPFTTGGATLPDGRAVFDMAPESFRADLFRLDEVGQNRYLRNAALQYMADHPFEALKLYLVKMRNFWWFAPQTGVLYKPQFIRGYLIYYSLIVALAIIGLWPSWKALHVEERILLLSLMLSVAVVQSVFYVEGRHRWTIEPVLLLLSGSGLNFMRILLLTRDRMSSGVS